MSEVLSDALIDTLKIMPLLFLTNILIEFVENAAVGKINPEKILGGKTAPLLGTAVGLIPQCGFSVVAAKLYCARHITLGTLLSVFVVTSDEAIPVLLSSPETAPSLLQLLLVKVVAALILGYGVTLLLIRRERKRKAVGQAEKITAKGCHGHGLNVAYEQAEEKKPKTSAVVTFFAHPVLHTLTVSLYILAVNVLLGTAIFFVGADKFSEVLSGWGFLQPFICALVGMIPNCAASVAIAELYGAGVLSLGGAAAGLCASSGLGLAVLCKENENKKESLAVCAITLGFSIMTGFVVELVCMAVGA